MAATIDAAAIARQAKAISDQAPDVRLAMANTVRGRIKELETQLDRQFVWLGQNQSHDQWSEFYDRWQADLRHYERACDALKTAPTATQERLIA